MTEPQLYECRHGHRFDRAQSIERDGQVYCPTCESAAPPAAAADLIACPHGHRFTRDQAVIRGGRVLCPVCTSGGWAPPPPRRRSYGGALWVATIGAGLLTLAAFYNARGALNFSDDQARGHGWEMIGWGVVTLALLIAAVVASRND